MDSDNFSDPVTFPPEALVTPRFKVKISFKRHESVGSEEAS